MERLVDSCGNLKQCAECVENPNCYSNHSCGHIKESIAKLKEYEDLEDKGFLLKLPCKVGDTVYHTHICDTEPTMTEMEVACVEPCGAIRNHKGVSEIWNVYTETDYTKEYFKFSDFGKTVFLTRAEAEEALKGMPDSGL